MNASKKITALATLSAFGLGALTTDLVPRGESVADATSPLRFEQQIARVAAELRPSVVSIIPMQDRGRYGVAQAGLGTGFVIDAKGYVITNHHVVAGADRVTVELHDGTRHLAKVVGTDAKTDIALLDVDAKDLTAVKLGNSADLSVGDWVVAAGNPFGLASSITAGIVSAKGRSKVGISEYEDFIQTDAAINPGNSGGPLVNLEGEVIGVNSAIFSKSGGYMGIGFAIPIDMVKTVQQRLHEDGRMVRGWLGVSVRDAVAKDGGTGAFVAGVVPGGPAESAGLREGDVITSINGKSVADSTRLRLRASTMRPGSKVELTLQRGSETERAQVEIDAMPELSKRACR
ncbi:MAG: PDZ domain-containing protein [bacterium]|nr:PDZ domain-containing protein [bacterium]